MSNIKINFHCYNNYAYDFGYDVARIINAGYKYDNIEIDFMDEGLDIRQVEYKGTKFLDILSKICEENNWPKKKFKIITSNFIQPASTWPNMEIIRKDFNDFTLPAKILSKVNDKNIKKHFGMYICNSSWARLWLSSYMFNSHGNITDQSFVRDIRNPGHACNLDLDQLFFYFSKEKNTDHIDLEGIAKFLKIIPLTNSKIDVLTMSDHFNFSYGTNGDLSVVADELMARYQYIFCDIVSECYFIGETFHLTEKIARPLVAKTPFLAIGSINYLKNLKLLGFKTFDKFWDESYDYCEGSLRLLKMRDVIRNLSNKPIGEILDMYEKMLPILEHNQKRYLELCNLPITTKLVKNFISASS